MSISQSEKIWMQVLYFFVCNQQQSDIGLFFPFQWVMIFLILVYINSTPRYMEYCETCVCTSYMYGSHTQYVLVYTWCKPKWYRNNIFIFHLSKTFGTLIDDDTYILHQISYMKWPNHR
jgi:hypothetical protein